MKSTAMVTIVGCLLGSALALTQGQAQGRQGGQPAPPQPARQVTVTAIPGVIEAGATWTEVWQVKGNNADGIVPAPDGGLLLAQEDNSAVVKRDTSGQVTVLGENMQANGIVLSPDDKTLYVTNGTGLLAFDVRPDGTVANRRDFARLEAGGNGDGMAVDAAGRVYVTSAPGVQVFGADGKYLGLIPTPRNAISVAFAGRDKKTLYVVTNGSTSPDGTLVTGTSRTVYRIPMLVDGVKGRAK